MSRTSQFHLYANRYLLRNEEWSLFPDQLAKVNVSSGNEIGLNVVMNFQTSKGVQQLLRHFYMAVSSPPPTRIVLPYWDWHIVLIFCQLFNGNTDGGTVVYHDLNPPIRARYIRFCPKEFSVRIAMRVELYGCSGNTDFPVLTNILERYVWWRWNRFPHLPSRPFTAHEALDFTAPINRSVVRLSNTILVNELARLRVSP